MNRGKCVSGIFSPSYFFYKVACGEMYFANAMNRGKCVSKIFSPSYFSFFL
jgi:hypothetical protein